VQAATAVKFLLMGAGAGATPHYRRSFGAAATLKCGPVKFWKFFQILEART